MTERMDLEVTPRTSHEHVRMLLDSDVSKCRDERTLPLGGKANNKDVQSQLAS
jgi:hypothetical protein